MVFWLSKLLWFVVAPSNLLLLMLLAGIGLLMAGCPVWGRRLAVAAALLLGLVTVLPVGTWAYGPLENRFQRPEPPPEKVTGIIVLGGFIAPAGDTVETLPELNDSADRLAAFLALANRYPEAELVFTGGSGDPLRQDVSEAQAVSALLERTGMYPGRLQLESRSRNTWENARNSRALVRPGPEERWLLITSGYHMPRAVGCFRAAGWPEEGIVPWPVDDRAGGGGGLPAAFLGGSLQRLDQAAHEWLGLVAYRLMGRTSSLFPAPR